MSRHWRILAAVTVVATLLAGSLHAAEPAREFLYTKQTSLAPGAYKFVFSLWDSPTATSPLWSSGQVSLTLGTPVLVYTLGSGTLKIPATIDFSRQLYLSVQKVSPAPKATIVKRERLPIAPYARGSGQRICLSGDFVSCFPGTLEQLNVGVCRAGTRFCNAAGTGFDATCIGATLPRTETCNGLDDDCDGNVDEECAVCGDGFCDPGEDTGTCATDCPGACGDGICNFAWGEDATSCPADCVP